jgi:hypothetical protein
VACARRRYPPVDGFARLHGQLSRRRVVVCGRVVPFQNVTWRHGHVDPFQAVFMGCRCLLLTVETVGKVVVAE